MFCAGADPPATCSPPTSDKAIALEPGDRQGADAGDRGISGPAIGAGLQLAMVSDLRVVDPTAFFQFPSPNMVWPLMVEHTPG